MIVDREALIQLAREAAQRAYVPYSQFPVGAAMLTDRGEIITGCNVENASYPLTMCAERTAIGTVVSQGAGKVVAVAVSAPKAKPCSPCGACRQVLYEFNPDMQVILDAGDAEPLVLPLTELLPYGFNSLSLENA
ncbi:Cytidine deaminase [compost metagenome]